MEIYPTTCGRRGSFSCHTGYDSKRIDTLLVPISEISHHGHKYTAGNHVHVNPVDQEKIRIIDCC